MRWTAFAATPDPAGDDPGDVGVLWARPSPTEQYLTWAKNFVQVWNYPDAWGQSFTGSGLVQERVFEKVLGTLRLMVTALLLALIIGIPLGIYQAIKQYSFLDQTATTASFITFSTPIFVVGIGLQILLALYLERWTGVKFFYTSGMNSVNYSDLSFWAKLGDSAQHLVLPAMSIALISIAAYSRFQRATMLEVLHSDYMRTAKAKGLPPHRHSQARTAQRADPDRHPRLIGHRRTPRGSGDHRVDLRVAGDGPPLHRGDQLQRLADHHGPGGRDQLYGGRHELARRPGIRVVGPAGAV